MERKNLTNSTINAIMKTMTDNEKKELEDKFNEHIKNLEDFVEVMFRELFEPKKTINKESKIKNENT